VSELGEIPGIYKNFVEDPIMLRETLLSDNSSESLGLNSYETFYSVYVKYTAAIISEEYWALNTNPMFLLQVGN